MTWSAIELVSILHKVLRNRKTAFKGTIDDTWIDYIDCDDTRRIISLLYTLLWPSRLWRSGHAVTGGHYKGQL